MPLLASSEPSRRAADVPTPPALAPSALAIHGEPATKDEASSGGGSNGGRSGGEERCGGRECDAPRERHGYEPVGGGASGGGGTAAAKTANGMRCLFSLCGASTVLGMGEEMPIRRIAFGDAGEARHPAALRAALAEFISMIIFILAGQGTGMAFSKMTYESPLTPTGFLVAALAHAFALSVAVSVGTNISGGHVNPAVTFGAFLGGNITLLRAVLYWIAQLLGSMVACVLLKDATGGVIASASALSSEVSVWNAMLLEIVMTFGLVYTVYATAVDTKKGNLGIVAPIMIGLIVGANILVGGAFDGESMNPAASFGPAVVSRVWKHHWVFWVGPMIGAALAALVYDMVYIGSGV